MARELIPAVLEAVQLAGEAIMEVRAAARLDVRQKTDGPVTAADLAANTLLEARLRALVPAAAWLSEETADSRARLDAGLVWVVDPLDGTQEFINGTPHFGVSVALVGDGRPLLGVIHFPAASPQETYHAVSGGGAWDGAGNPLRVSDRARPSVLTARWGDVRQPWMQTLKETLGVRLRPVGSTVRKLATVACGETDGYLSLKFAPYEWDICAGDLLITEAGGILTDLRGDVCRYNRENPLAMHGMAACSRSVHAALLEQARRLA